MARTRTVTDESLLDAAIELIMREGPARLTFAALGRQTRLAPATLVQRFGTKDALLVAAAEHCLGDISRAFEIARQGHTAPLEALIAALTSLTEQIDSVATFANGLAFLQMDLMHPRLHELTCQGETQMQDQIKECLDDAIAAKELLPCSTRDLAVTIQTAYHGALVTWAIYQTATLGEWLTMRLEDILRPYRVGC